MKTIRTTAIVLGRTDYGEAERILSLLTPDHGKLRLMARGVRKVKSKLAGGIELFSVSDITFITGRGEIGTLVSARLATHYSGITADLDRLNLGYELIKALNKATEDEPEPEYFALLNESFKLLADPAQNPQFIKLWFMSQLLRLAGVTPNLRTDTYNNKLAKEENYKFDYQSVSFMPSSTGSFQAPQIKTLRLIFSTNSVPQLIRVGGISDQLEIIQPLLHNLAAVYLNLQI